MNGYGCVREAIRIFELRLTQRMQSSQTDKQIRSAVPLAADAAQLAAISGYSHWHFSRLFTALTGTTPKSYVTGRLLSECAAAIVRGADTPPYGTLNRLALAAGFADYETFSRSFKRHFKISPRTLQKQGTLDGVAAYLIFAFDADRQTLDAAGGTHAAVPPTVLRTEIVYMTPFHITGLSFFLDQKQASFGKLWRAFDAKQHRIGARKQPEQFCQYTAWTPSEHPDSCGDDSILVVCALATDAAQVQEPVFVNRTIPGGTFLHVVHSGSMETIGETYAAIYRDIVAVRTAPLVSCWEYQLYNADGSTDIFIPLE